MKKFNARKAYILLIVVALFLAIGCQNTESKPGIEPKPAEKPVKNEPKPAEDGGTAAEAGRTLRFAFIPKALHIPVFNYAKIGAERQAKEYGNVEILWDAPLQNDQAKQKEILEKFVAEGVDGIAISVLNADYLTPAIDKAVDAGIPVVTWDSDAPKSKRAAFYGVNDFEAGVIMGKEMASLLGERGGEVAVLTTVGADNLAKRLEGAMSVLRPISSIKVVETFDVEDQLAIAQQVIKNASKTYPDLAGWLSVGGWPGFSREILEPIDTKKTVVVTFDTIPPAPELVAEGKIKMALGQKYFGWGSVPTRLLYEIVTEGKYPEHAFVDSGVDVVTGDNVAAYREKWKGMEAGKVVE